MAGRVRSVSMYPGAMPLTWTPWGAHSLDRARIIPAIPDLVTV